MGTNKPVRITDAKSGLIRRLIDVSPTGDKVEPNEYKTIVYMYYYEGYSTPEIAKMLKRPDATVRTRLARARKLLKRSLGDAADA